MDQSNRGRHIPGDSAAMSAATLRKLGHKDESAETLDLHGVLQPKSLRAKIDLREVGDG